MTLDEAATALKYPMQPAARKPLRSDTDGRYDSGRRRVTVILKAAKKTLVNGGYSQLTLRRVESEAGLPLRHLQYYYPTKQTLLRALCQTICADYIAKCDALSAREHVTPMGPVDCVHRFFDRRQPRLGQQYGFLRALGTRLPRCVREPVTGDALRALPGVRRAPDPTVAPRNGRGTRRSTCSADRGPDRRPDTVHRTQ